METKSRRKRKQRVSQNAKTSIQRKMGLCNDENAFGASNTCTAANASCLHSSKEDNPVKASQCLSSKSSLEKSFKMKGSAVCKNMDGKSYSTAGLSDSVRVADSSVVKDCFHSTMQQNSKANCLDEHKFSRKGFQLSNSGKRRKGQQENLSHRKQDALQPTNVLDRTDRYHNCKSEQLLKGKLFCYHLNERSSASDTKHETSQSSSVPGETSSESLQSLSTSVKSSPDLEICLTSQDLHESENRTELSNHKDEKATSTGPRESTDADVASTVVDAEEVGRQLHSCPQPWRSGLKSAPVQLCTGSSRVQLHHRQLLALMNRITDTKMELLVQKAADLLLQPRPCGSLSVVCRSRDCTSIDGSLRCSSCTAAALCPSQLFTRRMDLITMLLHKAQDEELFTEHYCQFLREVSVALELHDDALMDDLAPLWAEVDLLQKTCCFSHPGKQAKNETTPDEAVSLLPTSEKTDTALLESRINLKAKLAARQRSLAAEETNHLLRGAPSFSQLVQEESVRKFHQLLGTLMSLYTGAVTWCNHTDVRTRRHIKCHMRLLVLLHYACLLPLRVLNVIRDAVAAPLQAAFSTNNSVQHGHPPALNVNDEPPVLLLSVELLCSFLLSAGPCNLHMAVRTRYLFSQFRGVSIPGVA
ncbi:hypothetical protein FHG87_000438 [Trinorchestia longiramus]|nr:hypothetical protein FHG87_000438 [Trinorchestia longiramus]